MSLLPKSLLALSLLAATPAWAETAVADLAPPGAHVLDRVIGDLNGDQRPDEALVYEVPSHDDGDMDNARRTLVIALRDPQGRLKRAASYSRAILCKKCGGIFGDPFEDIKIQRGALVIEHYGGSRDRWGYTDKFMRIDGRWVWIGMTDYLGDTLNGDAFTRDEDVWTGLVIETTKIKQQTATRAFRELRAGLLPADFRIGAPSDKAWTTPGFRLGSADDVVAGHARWSGPRWLSARLHAGHDRTFLYVRADVTASAGTRQDGLRVLAASGRRLAPDGTARWRTADGYVTVERFRLAHLTDAATLKRVLKPSAASEPAATGLIPLTIEVVRGPVVLSTNRSGAKASGYIRLASKPGASTLEDLDPENRVFDVPPAWNQRSDY